MTTILQCDCGAKIETNDDEPPDVWTCEECVRTRLEELREILRSESMSYGELAELQDLAPHIEAGDVELLEAAGVPEEVAYDAEQLQRWAKNWTPWS